MRQSVQGGVPRPAGRQSGQCAKFRRGRIVEGHGRQGNTQILSAAGDSGIEPQATILAKAWSSLQEQTGEYGES